MQRPEHSECSIDCLEVRREIGFKKILSNIKSALPGSRTGCLLDIIIQKPPQRLIGCVDQFWYAKDGRSDTLFAMIYSRRDFADLSRSLCVYFLIHNSSINMRFTIAKARNSYKSCCPAALHLLVQVCSRLIKAWLASFGLDIENASIIWNGLRYLLENWKHFGWTSQHWFGSYELLLLPT